MSTFTQGTKWNNATAAITPDVSKAKTVTLSTGGKYVDRDIEITVNPMSAGSAATCTVAGGGLSGGGLSGGALSGGSLSGGGLTAGNGSVGLSKLSADSTSYGAKNINADLLGAITEGTSTSEPSTFTSGYFIAFDASGSGSVNRAAVTRAKIDRAKVDRAAVTRAAITDAHTAGYLPAKDATIVIAADSTTIPATSIAADSIAADSTTIPATSQSSNTAHKYAYIPITAGAIGNSTTDPGTTYTESNVAVPSKGWLTLSAGYYPKTKLSLDTILEGKADTAGTGVADLRLGYVAYDVDGNRLVGEMPDATTSGSDVSGSATASASITPQIATTLYKTTATTGYTLVDTATASASSPAKSATATVSAGYLAEEKSVSASVSSASDSKSASLYIKNATTSGSDASATASATASANAYASTSNLATGTYTTSATSGYTYHVDSTASASASVSNVSATKTVNAGLLTENTSITASVAGKSSGTKSDSKTTYLLDSTSKVGTTNVASGDTISAGSTLTIGKGYYPTDRTFVAQSAKDTAPGSIDSVDCSKANIGSYDSTNEVVPITTTHTVNYTAGYIAGSSKSGLTDTFNLPAYNGTYTVTTAS